MRPIS
jgi:hypothetical protein